MLFIFKILIFTYKIQYREFFFSIYYVTDFSIIVDIRDTLNRDSRVYAFGELFM